MNKRLVAGNWKMNPGTLEEAKKIAQKVRGAAVGLERTEAVICPPFPFIDACAPKKPVPNFLLGAQSASTEEGLGAKTGEVSAVMLKGLGVDYVIVGHSERRERGDTDDMVGARLRNVLAQGMQAIVCVGEKVRDADGLYMEGLKKQIENTLTNIQKKYAKNIVIAYEPVWAIGAKEAMRPEQVYEMSLFVKKVFADIFTPDVGVKTRVLYGGSVNAMNAAEIISVGQVDGLLVGRESVNPSGFVDLLRAVDSVSA